MSNKRAIRRGTALDVFEAFRQVVYTFGVPELAARMGQRPGTLYNKADASDETHHQPTLRDVVLVTQVTGDMRVLDALDETFGRAAFDTRAHGDASDSALLELLADFGAENGDFHRALSTALRDQRFTAEELAKVRAEAFDVVSALMTLMRRLQGLVDD